MFKPPPHTKILTLPLRFLEDSHNLPDKLSDNHEATTYKKEAPGPHMLVS